MSLAERMRKSFIETKAKEDAAREARKRSKEDLVESQAETYIADCKQEAETAINKGDKSFTMPCKVEVNNQEIYFTTGPNSYIAFKRKVESWATSEGLKCNILDVDFDKRTEHAEVSFWCQIT